MERKLYKSDTDKKVCGVCGGLADCLDVDVSIVRGVMAILVLSSLYGILIYFVMAVVMPVDNREVKVLSNRKVLYKSQEDKLIFGVCGGIAEYINVNPMLIRLICIFSVLWFGSGILVYIVMAVVMPSNDTSSES